MLSTQVPRQAETVMAPLQPLTPNTTTSKQCRAQDPLAVAEAGAMRDGTVESLLWLLHYPLLRARDLAALQALSVSATAARLAHMRAAELVCTLPARLLGRRAEPLYALTLTELGALAERYGAEVWDIAQRTQATPSGLLRLIPQLPGVLTTQSFVLALMTQTPASLLNKAYGDLLNRLSASQERQAHWTWTRHARVRALDLDDGTTRRTQVSFHADAALRLALSAPALSDASPRCEATSPSYRLLILWDGGLEPHTAIRRKLQALLRVRETYERRGRLAAFPSLLVLAPNARRAEQWQAQALRLATERWLTHPLLGGALALEDSRDHTKESGWEVRHDSALFPPAPLDTLTPWHAEWRSFARPQTQSLIALLQPDRSPDESLDLSPSSVGMRNMRKAQGRPALLPQTIRRQRVRTTTEPTVRREERVRLARVALRLDARSLRLLALLYQHPYLSTGQLATILGVRSTSAERMLRSLAHSQLIQSAKWASGQHIALSDVGVKLIAQSAQLPSSGPRRQRNPSHAPSHAPRDGMDGSPRVVWSYRREAQALARIPTHTDGVYRFFTSLLSACAAEQVRGHDAALCWWETGSVCARAYRAYTGWQVIRPDGAGECQMDGRRTEFWLEWDCGTMGLRDLRAKFAAYARFVSSQEWCAEGSMSAPLPLLLIVTPSAEQEALVEQALRTAFPPTIPFAVYLATESSLLAHWQGPLAPIWRLFGGRASPCVQLTSPLTHLGRGARP